MTPAWTFGLVIGGMALLFAHDAINRRRARRHLAGRPPLSAEEFGRTYFGSSDSLARVAARTRQILARHLPVELEGLAPDDKLVADLRMDALDSMSTVEFVWELEKEFGVKIPNKEAEAMWTFRDVVSYVHSHVGADWTAGAP